MRLLLPCPVSVQSGRQLGAHSVGVSSWAASCNPELSPSVSSLPGVTKFDIWLSSPVRFLTSSWTLIWLDSACVLWTGHSLREKPRWLEHSVNLALLSRGWQLLQLLPASSLLQSVAPLGPLLAEWGSFLPSCFLPSSLRLQSPAWLQSPAQLLWAWFLGVYNHLGLGIWQILQEKCLFKMVESHLCNSIFPQTLAPQVLTAWMILNCLWSFQTHETCILCLDSVPWTANHTRPQSGRRPLPVSVPCPPPPGDDLGCLGCIWCFQTAVSFTCYPALLTIICGSVGLAQHIL